MTLKDADSWNNSTTEGFILCAFFFVPYRYNISNAAEYTKPEHISVFVSGRSTILLETSTEFI